MENHRKKIIEKLTSFGLLRAAQSVSTRNLQNFSSGHLMECAQRNSPCGLRSGRRIGHTLVTRVTSTELVQLDLWELMALFDVRDRLVR
jgi:hypothetical protein